MAGASSEPEDSGPQEACELRAGWASSERARCQGPRRPLRALPAAAANAVPATTACTGAHPGLRAHSSGALRAVPVGPGLGQCLYSLCRPLISPAFINSLPAAQLRARYAVGRGQRGDRAPESLAPRTGPQDKPPAAASGLAEEATTRTRYDSAFMPSSIPVTSQDQGDHPHGDTAVSPWAESSNSRAG